MNFPAAVYRRGRRIKIGVPPVRGKGSGLERHNRMFGADLGAHRAARTKIRIDPNLLVLYKKSGTGQIVDAIAVIFAFVADCKRSAVKLFHAFGEQGAGFL